MSRSKYPFVCERCGEVFTDWHKYASHLQSRLDPKNKERKEVEKNE
jgi:uncharacterized C2H2 Zn-finger protein